MGRGSLELVRVMQSRRGKHEVVEVSAAAVDFDGLMLHLMRDCLAHFGCNVSCI
jgi:hypothetical protein